MTWVGHPLLDRIPPAATPAEERRRRGLAPEGPAVAVLPGSRSSEVRRIAPVLAATRRLVDAERARSGLPPVRWLLGRAGSLPPGLLRAYDLETSGDPPPNLSGVDALRCADLALVASGTVTLEATLLGRPVIVVYRMHPLTFFLARRLVQVEHIAMANLLAGRRLLPEYVQGEARPEVLAAETLRLLSAPEELAAMRDGLLQARATLGPPGAADRAAEAVLAVLEAP